ncbi:MAG: hypothetical protein H0V82_01015 [Candidatus Protochlamydia sp.]|nr:hypothetical protein [Candidatus Protochlamydia sp.]
MLMTLLEQQGSKLNALTINNYKFDGDVSPTETGKGRHIDWIWIKSSSAELVPIHNIPKNLVASNHCLWQQY